MKTVLVTGSNGFLGMKLTGLLLADKNRQLIATGRGANRYPNTQGYVYDEMDCTNAEQVKAVFERHQPDTVIHSAAISQVDVCEQNPALAERSNVIATEILAREAQRHNAHFTLLSTDFVFDGQSGPYGETDLTCPVNVYGRTKAAAEKIVAKTASSAIVRTILVYGQPVDASRSNFILWVKKALENGQRIKVAADHWRMPTLVDDLAQACLGIAEKRLTGIFHLSGAEEMSVYELAVKAARFWKLDESKIEPVTADLFLTSAVRPARTGFRIEKARKAFGYQPRTLGQGFILMDSQRKAMKE